MEQVKIQVLFTADTPYGQFTDALYFTTTEYGTLSESDINQRKQVRIDNYVNLIKNTVPSPAPTKVEIQKQITELDSQKLILQDQLSKAV